jgi:N-acetylated-alpha-linked acidic dipeptidase
MRIAIALAAALAVDAQQQPIRGFAPDRLAGQKQLEDRYRLLPEPSRAKTYMRRMAAEPHHAGSPGSRAVANYALGLFQEWGFDARIEEFEALLPYPAARSVEMTAPVPFRARMAEPAVPHDPDSGDRNQLPTYNAYSAPGDVTAPLVYVNYGIPADYAVLDKLGIGVKGRIVLARYGQSWRGTKAKAAQERGAVACLIYSDPREDGYWQGDVFPKGPFRPAESAQRGSVMDMPRYVGDPLSPGWASEKGSRRLAPAEAGTVMKIPVLPLSQADAQPLLANLGGPVAPPEWRGALPITYHVGPGEAVVRVRAAFDNATRPVLNVMATLRGEALPDEWIVYGNHHDAWVNGAADPISGAVALMETARSMAELRKSGWRPRRTMVFALWDAEEFGLIGSTEWAEKHASALRAKAVAYLNSDMNTGGGFSAGGSPILEQFLRQVMRDVRDPATGATLASSARDFRLSPPGAGSDYVAFIHHLGIAGLNLGFTQPGSQGTYHSIYDSYAWFTKHMDKDLKYARGLANVMGTAMLRLSEASILPHEFTALHTSLAAYLADLRSAHPKLALAPVAEQVDALKDRAARYQQAYESALTQAADPAKLAALNARIAASERALLRKDGLPGRPWYKHQVYAPGLYTGYSARTLPGVREPADLGRMDEATAQIPALADTLRALNAHIDKLTTMLGQL